MNRTAYFGNGRVNDVTSMPFSYHVEREVGGSNIYLYYLPDSTYTAEYSGKFALTEVTMFQDMSETYDMFYLEYLRYALAEMMCMEWDITFPADKRAMLTKYEKKLLDTSPPDLTMQKANFLNIGLGTNWAQINIGKGYVP
jgi:hypothetical protein